MFWTIFFAVVAAMFVPVLLAWSVIGAVGLVSFFVRLRARHPVVQDFLVVGALALAFATAIAVASGR